MSDRHRSAPAWWTPSTHADRRPFLIGRNRIQAAFRSHFADQDFVEVDTATLQVSPGNEAHLHAFKTEALGHDGSAVPLYSTLRRNSPARSYCLLAKPGSPVSPMSTAIASVAHCTIPSLRCWNGTVLTKVTSS